MPGSRKRILWADTEIEFLRSHITFLETRGYSVVPVVNGDDAVMAVTDKPGEFDIVLLDERMPGKGVISIAEKIKLINGKIPVVVVTRAQEQIAGSSSSKKIDGYLSKPVTDTAILNICKKLLDSTNSAASSRLSQKFFRHFSDMRTFLTNRMSAEGWIRVNESLAKWDIELADKENEGLRQIHTGQKSDADAAFSEYLVENYAKWIKNEFSPPLLSIDIVNKFLAPALHNGEKVCFIVLSGMRVDQYLLLEHILRDRFEIKRNYFYSILPSASPYSLNALLGGAFPSNLNAKYNDLWIEDVNDSGKQLLLDKLSSLQINIPSESDWFFKIEKPGDICRISPNEYSFGSSRFITVVSKFLDLVLPDGSTVNGVDGTVGDENGLRKLAQSWFCESSFQSFLTNMGELGYTIILTSDHGCVLCNRGTELYGVEEFQNQNRYIFGKNISCDERTAAFLQEPAHFGIPRPSDEANLIIAKGNYYFMHPDKLELHKKQFKSSFQRGGTSLEEVVMPLAVCKSI